jgi:hypothetical protein
VVAVPRRLSSPLRRFPVSSALAVVGRSAVDASAYSIKALGFRGCLAVTICTCTAVVLLQINLTAVFQAAAAESTKQATVRWSFQLASETVQTLLYQKSSEAGLRGIVALVGR